MGKYYLLLNPSSRSSRLAVDRSPQMSPGHEGQHQPKVSFLRPPYLDEDPWSSSTPPKDLSHWTRVRQLLNKCDGDAIGSWQEEINTQLIVVSRAIPFADGGHDRFSRPVYSLR